MKAPGTRSLSLLLHPVFLLSLALLLLNDLWFKPAFHNALTGKLSDFAGLFAFAVVGRVLFARAGRLTPVLVAGLLFLFWKSPLSAPLLEAWNGWGGLKLHRVEDWTDLLALLVLPAVCLLRAPTFAERTDAGHPSKAVPQLLVLGLALFSFVATSYQDEFSYDKQYDFPFSQQELIRRLNALNTGHQLGNLPISPHHRHANDFENRSGIRYYYHHDNQGVVKYDTIVVEVTDTGAGPETTDVEINKYLEPERDTLFLNPEGYFYFSFPLPSREGDPAKSQCSILPAYLRLSGEGERCALRIRSVEIGNCERIFEDTGGKSVMDFVLAEFEKGLVERLR